MLVSIFNFFPHPLAIMTERYSEYIKNSNQCRKATATAKAHLESFYTNVSIDEATDLAERQLPEFVEQIAECSGQVADCGDRAEFGDVSEQDLETIMETECTEEAYPCTVGDCGNGDESDEDEQPTMTTSLMNWAIEYGITLVALTALLSILRHHHPSLPKRCQDTPPYKQKLHYQASCRWCILLLWNCKFCHIS